MPIVEAIVLGIVQGLSEFLPISSSGHLELTRWLFGWDSLPENLETAFDVSVHLGTLVGAIAYLWRDVVRYTTAGLVPVFQRVPLSTDGRIFWALMVSVVPAGATGLILKDQLEELDRIWLIATMLIVFAIVLAVADRLPERRGVDEFGVKEALSMGVGQALALQPGVSRSGVTLSVGRGIGFSRDAAARLTFLMSLPVIAGAGVVALSDVTIPSEFWPAFIWGMVASAVTGWLAVWGTLKLVRTRTFRPFVIYRVAVGVGVLVILATGWR
jgi:undecaprenyl-diphosphatase